MINLAAARAGLARIIETHTTRIKAVYPRAIDDPIIPTPAVILAALVEGDFDQTATACLTAHQDKITIPVAVLVARDGTAEAATQQELEDAWVEVLDVLRGHLDDPELAQVGYLRQVVRVEAGEYTIAGAEYPAQILHIDFHG